MSIRIDKELDVIQIYQLVDPRDGTVRWIGRTHNIKARISEHLSCSRRSNANKNVWTAELKAAGLHPIIQVIEEADNEIAHERELYWLQFYQAKGEPLLNRSEINPEAKHAGRRSTDFEYAEKWWRWQLYGEPCPFRNPGEAKKHIPKTYALVKRLHELKEEVDILRERVTILETQIKNIEVSTKEV